MASFRQFVELINKDTKSNNESKKMTVIVRTLCLFAIAFELILAGFCLVEGIANIIPYMAIGMAVYGLVLFASYKVNKKSCVVLYILTTIAWCTLNLWIFGWYCGAQTMVIQMILIYYFASYGKLINKIVFSIMTFAIYMVLYVRFSHTDPYIQLAQHQLSFLRVIFVLLIITCMSTASYLFSNESQDMENKLVEYNKKLEKKSSTDPLTGLYNRGKAMELLAELEAKADSETFSLCICDIDFFKKVNDNYGHDVGDKVLIEVAGILKRIVREYGFVSRWGGEEFMIAFPKTNGDDACTVIYTIQSEIRKMSVKDGDNEIKVTLTYGLTEFDSSIPLDKNIKDADNKLYHGKEEGRNRLIY